MTHPLLVRRLSRCALLLVAACAAADDRSSMEGGKGSARGAGVVLAPGAVAYVGSAAFCSRPATLDADKVRAATPEALEIRRDGVREGSARWSLLQSAMHERMLRAAAKVARQGGYDLVARHGDIADARGLVIDDVTGAAIGAL